MQPSPRYSRASIYIITLPLTNEKHCGRGDTCSPAPGAAPPRSAGCSRVLLDNSAKSCNSRFSNRDGDKEAKVTDCSFKFSKRYNLNNESLAPRLTQEIRQCCDKHPHTFTYGTFLKNFVYFLKHTERLWRNVLLHV